MRCIQNALDVHHDEIPSPAEHPSIMKLSLISSAVALLPSFVSLAHAGNYSNPLRDVDGGDPSIVWHEGYYYFMSTNSVDLQMTRATTLEGLKDGETKQVWVDSTPSRCCYLWAPEMHYIDGAWHMYYSAGPNPPGVQGSHVLRGQFQAYMCCLSQRTDFVDRWSKPVGCLLVCWPALDTRLGH